MWDPCTFTVWIDDIDDAGPPRIAPTPHVKARRSVSGQQYQYHIVRVPPRDRPFTHEKKIVRIPMTPIFTGNENPSSVQLQLPPPSPKQPPKPDNQPRPTAKPKKDQSPPKPAKANPTKKPKDTQNSPPLKSCLKSSIKKVRFADAIANMDSPPPSASPTLTSTSNGETWELSSDTSSNMDDDFENIPYRMAPPTTPTPIAASGDTSHPGGETTREANRINLRNSTILNPSPIRRVMGTVSTASYEIDSETDSNMDDDEENIPYFAPRATAPPPARSGTPPPSVADVRRAVAANHTEYVRVFRTNHSSSYRGSSDLRHVRFVLPPGRSNGTSRYRRGRHGHFTGNSGASGSSSGAANGAGNEGQSATPLTTAAVEGSNEENVQW